jgi:benzodiazapine receptor
MRRLVRYALFIALAQAAGLIGTYFTVDAIPTWYAALRKPSFAPPNWVFAPAWTTLYALMGIAAARAWELRTRKTNADRGLNWYWAQLALNAIWSPVFFGMKNLGLALIVIGVMWVTIIMTIREFWKAEKGIALLLVPYLAWVSFASVLNYALWMLN